MKLYRMGLLMVLVLVGVVVAWAVAESKTPEIPQDLKYRYMTHAFQRSELERQFTQSLTPQQRSLSDGITELSQAIAQDEQAMKATCGSLIFGYTQAGEPTCSPKPRQEAKK